MSKKIKILKIVYGFVFLIIFNLNIQGQAVDDIPIEVKKLTERIIFIKTGETSVLTNVLAVSTDKGIIVFDSTWLPGLARRVKKIIEQEFGRKNFAYLIMTHAGFDHSSGSQIFKEAVIVGHDMVPSRMEKNIERIGKPDTFFYMAFQNAKKALQVVEKGSREENERNEFVKTYAILLNETESPDFVITPPDITFNDRLNLKFADLTLHIVHNVKSYSDNDIITYIPELKLLVVGDIFNNNRLPWIDVDSDIQGWIEIFKEFTDKKYDEIEYVIGGHSGLLTMAEVKEHLTYVKDLYDGINSAKLNGDSLDEIMNKFSFQKFNHLNNINPIIPGWGIDLHKFNIRNIWKNLDNQEAKLKKPVL